MDLKRIKQIFRKSTKNPNCIGTQEGYRVEYKKAFGWGSFPEYTKAMSAMANNKGGHIIFGIKDKPHELLGMPSKSLDAFRGRDLSIWSKEIRDYFEPSIIFERDVFEFDGKYYGVIQVEEATEKPIICKKYIEGKLRQGAIYYRYKAENTEIQYAELRKIIDIEKNKINDLWIQRINQISVAGVANTMVLDTHEGVLRGTNGAWYIGEKLLDSIRFVDKGKFVEQEGEPVLTIIGEVQSVKDTPIAVSIKEKEIGLSDNRIIEIFLVDQEVYESTEYLSYLANSQSRNLPVFYFLKNEGSSVEEAALFLSNIVGYQSSKNKLLERIDAEKMVYHQELTETGTSAYIQKKNFKQKLLEKIDLKNVDLHQEKYLFAAIRSLSTDEIIERKDYLMELLLYIYRKYYQSQDSNFRGEFKKAICYIDEVLYKPK